MHSRSCSGHKINCFLWGESYGTVCMLFPQSVALLPGVLARVHHDRVRLLFFVSFWPVRVSFSGPRSFLESSPWEIPIRRDLLPGPRAWSIGLSPEGYQLIDSRLSTEFVETILNARAPSTRKLYALKWHLLNKGLYSTMMTQSTASFFSA